MLRETKRPPGNPCVGSIGYVPPPAASARCGVTHAAALKLAHDFTFAFRFVSWFPTRVPMSAPRSSLSLVQERESWPSVYLIESRTRTGLIVSDAPTGARFTDTPASPSRTLPHVLPS